MSTVGRCGGVAVGFGCGVADGFGCGVTVGTGVALADNVAAGGSWVTLSGVGDGA